MAAWLWTSCHKGLTVSGLKNSFTNQSNTLEEGFEVRWSDVDDEVIWYVTIAWNLVEDVDAIIMYFFDINLIDEKIIFFNHILSPLLDE